MFYPRIQNQSQIQFSESETKLVNKGLQYILQYKNIKWIEILALEAETTITHLHITEKDHYRFMVAKNIKWLMKNHNNNNNNNIAKHEWKKKNIKKKIWGNNLIITRGDKRKTIIIMEKQEYGQVIQNSI
jgi:hypothetical protein